MLRGESGAKSGEIAANRLEEQWKTCSGNKFQDRHLMEKYADELKLLVELDERHDELLRELDDLDKQVEAVLALWLAEREARLKAA